MQDSYRDGHARLDQDARDLSGCIIHPPIARDSFASDISVGRSNMPSLEA